MSGALGVVSGAALISLLVWLAFVQALSSKGSGGPKL